MAMGTGDARRGRRVRRHARGAAARGHRRPRELLLLPHDHPLHAHSRAHPAHPCMCSCARARAGELLVLPHDDPAVASRPRGHAPPAPAGGAALPRRLYVPLRPAALRPRPAPQRVVVCQRRRAPEPHAHADPTDPSAHSARSAPLRSRARAQCTTEIAPPPCVLQACTSTARTWRRCGRTRSSRRSGCTRASTRTCLRTCMLQYMLCIQLTRACARACARACRCTRASSASSTRRCTPPPTSTSGARSSPGSGGERKEGKAATRHHLVPRRTQGGRRVTRREAAGGGRERGGATSAGAERWSCSTCTLLHAICMVLFGRTEG